MKKSIKNHILLFVLAIIVPVFVWQQVSFWGGNAKAADPVVTVDPQIAIDQAAAEAARQAAIDKNSDAVDSIESKIKKEAAAKAKLEQQNVQIGQSVAATQSAINKTQSVIKETAQTISRKEAEVQNLNDKIELQKSMLRGLLQQMYYNQGQPILNVVLTGSSFVDVFSDTDHLLTIEDKLRSLSAEIADTKSQVEQDKAELAAEKQKHEEILDTKVDQKQELVSDQVAVQGDIKEKEATIGELQEKLDKLKSDLSSLLGKSLSTSDIVEAAGIASRATGVRKDFILGELVVETNLGTFTGGCTYKNTRMREADKTVFKALMKELGYDVNSKKISCSPGYGYGGAMGVAQFMPTTWIGYKAYISSATGHKPPDPWSVIDGVMGMAKKLANGGATSRSGEKIASKRYYCGGPTSPYWNNKCNTYANNVQYWADNYEKKL